MYKVVNYNTNTEEVVRSTASTLEDALQVVSTATQGRHYISILDTKQGVIYQYIVSNGKVTTLTPIQN